MASYDTGRVSADGVQVFYRAAGSPTAPAILLLHGFPSSSHQFRNLIPLLAKKYRVYAPDLPGFGFTEVPAERQYKYTFDNLATTVEAFVDAVGLERYAIYIFDYGAPTGLRLALRRPKAITAIITQNGNAYEEGLGLDFWAPLLSYWKSKDRAQLETVGDKILNLGTTIFQYENGSPNFAKVQPEAYYLDQALLDRDGQRQIQLDLFADYGNNLPQYPAFQKYFRESGVPVLAIWGKNDIIFVPAGAEAFARDVKTFELHFVDAGHFAIETNELEFAERIGGFLEKQVK